MTITFDDVTVRFGNRDVVESFSAELTEPRVALIGANGSGKSTIARLINGLTMPSRGLVRVGSLRTDRDAAAIRDRVGFVFTNPDSQIVMPTVREDVAFTLRRSGLGAAERARRIDAVLEQFGLTELAEQSAHRLSGGQKQLLALAASLVRNPEILVADEPTTLLDARNARTVAEHLAALPQQVVMATHDLDAIRSWDRALVIDSGRLVADDAPAPAIAWYLNRVLG